MRDSILPQAQAQLDEMANQMSQALSNQTTSGNAVTSGSQAGFSVDVGALSAGNTVQLTYTDAQNNSHTVTIVALGAGGALPAQPANSSNPMMGVNLRRRHECGGVAAQCRIGHEPAILQSVRHRFASAQQWRRQCRQFAVGDFDRHVLAERQPAAAAVYRWTVNRSPGAITAGGSQTTGLAGTIEVNAALAASPSSLVAYASNTAAGDPTRPNFLLNQMTNAMLTYSPATGLGTASAPYTGTLSQYMSAVVNQQAQAANAATNLQQGQDTSSRPCSNGSTINPASISTPKCRT